MLEISSNGYPPSTSPVGGSPSPVGLPVHLSKGTYFFKYYFKKSYNRFNLVPHLLSGLQSAHKHSPINQSGKSLRVVIPTTSNVNSNDGSYSEVSFIIFYIIV
jgi:hypothetical protein